MVQKTDKLKELQNRAKRRLNKYSSKKEKPIENKDNDILPYIYSLINKR